MLKVAHKSVVICQKVAHKSVVICQKVAPDFVNAPPKLKLVF